MAAEVEDPVLTIVALGLVLRTALNGLIDALQPPEAGLLSDDDRRFLLGGYLQGLGLGIANFADPDAQPPAP